jgi:hypothetical protein
MAVYYMDNRARQKMLDNKAIYKRLVITLVHGSLLQGQQGQAEDAGQQGHLQEVGNTIGAGQFTTGTTGPGRRCWTTRPSTRGW